MEDIGFPRVEVIGFTTVEDIRFTTGENIGFPSVEDNGFTTVEDIMIYNSKRHCIGFTTVVMSLTVVNPMFSTI